MKVSDLQGSSEQFQIVRSADLGHAQEAEAAEIVRRVAITAIYLVGLAFVSAGAWVAYGLGAALVTGGGLLMATVIAGVIFLAAGERE